MVSQRLDTIMRITTNKIKWGENLNDNPSPFQMSHRQIRPRLPRSIGKPYAPLG